MSNLRQAIAQANYSYFTQKANERESVSIRAAAIKRSYDRKVMAAHCAAKHAPNCGLRAIACNRFDRYSYKSYLFGMIHARELARAEAYNRKAVAALG